MKNNIELLAPAGNMECLQTAFYCGADAAYVAGKSFGLRAFANNFSNEELKTAVDYAHDLGKKLYITANAVMYDSELAELNKHLYYLAQIQADGVIFSDPSVLHIVKNEGYELPLHLSTQANTTNSMSAAFWHEQGVQRIVLSRETSLNDIANIKKTCPSSLEIEVFVHGAMCIAHSGRCLMSALMVERSGNKGACAQPCRWEYYLHEKGYEGEYFNISADERGTYVLNSRDLMMIEHIQNLVESGAMSFKIEGRMKSPYYVASAVLAYRRAIDGYLADKEGYVFDESLKDELIKSATRGYTTGFFFGNPGEAAQDITRVTTDRKYTFVAKVIKDAKDGCVTVEQRNKFSIGEELEILSPNHRDKCFTVKEIINENGEEQESAPHPQQKVSINCPIDLKIGDILRRHD